MNKRQTRLFAIISTAIATLVFLALTVDSHRQFGKLTNAKDLSPQVISGERVWHKYNCINCHTLFGEGAYYAPDLTKITQLRGTQYLTAYLRDPSKFYDEAHHRRLMPNQHLSDTEIADVIHFLDWASKVDNQGWPPRPIVVTGGSIAAAAPAVAPQAAAEGQTGTSPIALGQKLFHTTPPGCFSCHSASPGVNLVGPSVAGIVARAEQVIKDPAYKGTAKDAEAFIRESIVHPSAYIEPGPMYSAGGQSFMPANYGEALTAQQIDQLVAYLVSLK